MLLCPACQSPLDLAPELAGTVIPCPCCGDELSVPKSLALPLPPSDRIDLHRIRQLALAARPASRIAAFRLIGGVAGIGVAVQLMVMSGRTSTGPLHNVLGAAGIASLYLAVRWLIGLWRIPR